MNSPNRILIIEDDADTREMLALVLRAGGFEALPASDGAAGLESLHQGPPPGLILLDLMMPRLDGREFLRRVEKDPAFASIPVVVLSGDDAVAHGQAIPHASASLKKPVRLEALLSTVDRLTSAGGKPSPAHRSDVSPG